MLGTNPKVLSLDPQYINDVLEDIKKVGSLTGKEDKAFEITQLMSDRIESVKSRCALVLDKPKVLSLEWVDPLMCGGHWVPEMVEIAGGVNCFGDKNTGSFKLEWQQILESKPDIIIFMPCGFDVKRGLEDVAILANKDGWESFPDLLV